MDLSREPSEANLEQSDEVELELRAAADKALAHYEALILDVRDQMARLRELERDYGNKIQALRALQPAEGAGAPIAMSNGQGVDSIASALDAFPSADRSSQAAIWAAAEAALRQGGPMHYIALADALAPYLSLRGRNPAATLLSYISRKPELFVRVKRGTYSVRDTALATVRKKTTRRKRRRRRSKRARNLAS